MTDTTSTHILMEVLTSIGNKENWKATDWKGRNEDNMTVHLEPTDEPVKLICRLRKIQW